MSKSKDGSKRKFLEAIDSIEKSNSSKIILRWSEEKKEYSKDEFYFKVGISKPKQNSPIKKVFLKNLNKKKGITKNDGKLSSKEATSINFGEIVARKHKKKLKEKDIDEILNIIKSSDFYGTVPKGGKKLVVGVLIAQLLFAIFSFIIMSLIGNDITWSIILGILSICVSIGLNCLGDWLYSRSEENYFKERQKSFRKLLKKYKIYNLDTKGISLRIGKLSSCLIFEFVDQPVLNGLVIFDEGCGLSKKL